MSVASDNSQSSIPAEAHSSAMDFLLGNEKPAVETPPETPPAPDADQPPVTTDPVDATPSTPDTPAAPSTNVYDSLAEISGGLIKSEDDFRSTIERATKYAELETQNQTLAQQLEAAKNVKPTYPNEYLQKLHGLYESGADASKIDIFQRINSLGDPKSLTNEEAIKWQLREQYGLTPEQADTKLRNTYKTDATLHTEEEVRAAGVDLHIEGNKAKEYLASLQASFEVTSPAAAAPEPTETPEQIAAKQRNYELALNPVVTSIDQELPTYFAKINTNGQEGDKADSVDMPIPDDVRTGIVTEVKRFATQQGIDISDPKNIETLKTYAKNVTKLAMYDKHIIHAANTREAKIREEFNNPDTIDRGNPNPAAPQKTSREAVASNVANTY